MYKAIIENTRGEKLQLFPSNEYVVKSIDGLTPPQTTLNFSVVATNDGSIYNSGRVENRNIVLSIAPIGNVEEGRNKLYKFFRLKQKCKFYFSNKKEVYIEGITEAIDGNLFTNGQTIQISIICPQPYFKALDEIVEDISQIVPLFEFPFSIAASGTAFSDIDKAAEKNVYSAGETESGLIIELRAIGNVSDPELYNEYGGGFKLDIDMQAGDAIYINTNKGEKSVTLLRNGNKTNIINLVQPNPTWFTLQPGDNVFSYRATNLDLLQIIFRHNDLFEGV